MMHFSTHTCTDIHALMCIPYASLFPSMTLPPKEQHTIPKSCCALEQELCTYLRQGKYCLKAFTRYPQTWEVLYHYNSL